MSEPLLRNFTHLVIPAEIWLRTDISLHAKCLWAEIYSLHCKQRGGCYASNEYLMKFMQLKDSRLREVLAELKSHGLLQDISFDGRITVRRAIVPETEYVTGGQPTGKPAGSNEGAGKPAGSAPETRRALVYKRKAHRKGNTCANKVDASEPAPLLTKIKRAECVATTKEEHDKLVKDFGEALTQEGYEDLAEWKKSALPAIVKKHTSDYRRLRKWVIPELKKPKGTPSMSNEELVHKHFKHGEKYGYATCWIDSDGIGFQTSDYNLKAVRFKDKGFRDQLNAILTAFGIPRI